MDSETRYRVVTFGEVMLRLSPPGYRRLLQATTLEMNFGGAEANVAVSLAQLGIESAFVSRLPKNDLAEACLNQMRGLGVDISCVLRGGDRLGLYFVETGAAQRPSTVLYDRADSAMAHIDPSELSWAALLEGASAFQFSGITPALSSGAVRATLEGAKAAREKGLLVVCDLNYRAKLWTTIDAGRTLSEILPYVDLFLLGESEASSLFGVTVPDAINDSTERHAAMARGLVSRFPGLKAVATTLREGHSASRNAWAGMLYLTAPDTAYLSRRYEFEIVDRIGGGDTFTAGLIYCLLLGKSPQESIEFAAAAGCLKHSIPGDFPYVRLHEVEALLAGDASGRVQR